MAIKTNLTDAERNRQDAINRMATGKAQGGINLSTLSPKLAVVQSANSKTGSLQKGIEGLIAPKEPKIAAPKANPDIIRQYDTTQGKAGSVVDTASILDEPKGPTSISEAITDFRDRSSGAAKDETIVVNPATGQPFTSAELLARSDLTKEWVGKAQLFKSVMGYDMPDMPTDLDNANFQRIMETRAKALKERQAFDTAQQERILKNSSDIEKSQYRTASEQSAGAVAATKQSLAQGRNGPQGSSAPKVASEFTMQMERNMAERRAAIDTAEAQREIARENLKRAQQSQDENLMQTFGEQLAAAENAVAKALAEQKTEAAKQSADAFKRVGDILALSQKAGAQAFEGMDASMIAESYGIDQATATALKAVDLKAGSVDVNDPDYQLKMANIARVKAETLSNGLSDTAKALETVTNLRYLGMDAAADKIAAKYGLEGTSAYSDIAKNAGEALSSQADTFSSTGAYVPTNGFYKVTEDGSGGIVVDTTVGECPANGRGQCGEFANDFYSKNSHLFGDSYLDKMGKNNSDVPVVGGAFIMKTGEAYGHVGIVTKVFSDGSFSFIDSNRHNRTAPETVDTGIINSDYLSQGITGFFDPSKPAPGWTPNPRIAEHAGQPKQSSLEAGALQDEQMESLARLYAKGDAKMADLQAYAATITNGAPIGSKYEKQENQKALKEMVARASQIKSIQENPKTFDDLSDEDKTLIQELADYSAPIEKFTNARSVEGQKKAAFLLNQVKMINPDFDMKEYTARQDFLKKWKGGDYRMAKDALNTATGHLTDLAAKIGGDLKIGVPMNPMAPIMPFGVGEVDVTAPKILSAAYKGLKKKVVGLPEQASWDANVAAVAGELAKVFKGTGTSNESEVNEWKETLPYMNTEAEKKAAVSEGVGLMISRMEAMKNSYESNMGKPIDQPLLSQEAFEEMRGLREKGFIDDEKWAKVENLMRFGPTSRMSDDEIYNQGVKKTEGNASYDWYNNSL